MPTDTGVLTNVLKAFQAVFLTGKGAVYTYAWHLLYLLGAIDFALAICFLVLTQGEVLPELVKKALTIGLFIFLVQGFGPGYTTKNQTYNLPSIIKAGFVQVGTVASGSQVGVNVFNDPSSVLDVGLQATLPIFQNLEDVSMFHLPKAIMTGLCGLLILAAYFILSLEVFVTMVEWGIVSTLGLILLPFGILKYTKNLAEGFFKAIVSYGIKLMVLAFCIGVSFPLLQKFTLPADPKWNQLFSILFASAAVAFLAHHAPIRISAALTGSPSLGGGTALMAAAVGARVLGGGGGGGGGSQKEGSSLTKSAASLAGQFSGGGVKAVGSSLKQGFKNASGIQGMQDSFKTGQNKATSALEGKTLNATVNGRNVNTGGSKEQGEKK